MKRGRTSWTIKCPPETLRRLAELAGSPATAREIYERLNLQRYARYSTFQHWLVTWRRDRQQRTAEDGGATATVPRGGFNQTGEPDRLETGPTMETGPTEQTGPTALPAQPVSAAAVDLVIAQCVEAISEAMAAGRIGKLDVGKALRSLAALKELSIAEAAEKRAAELHELKLVDLRSKVKQAVNEKSADGAKTLTREDVYDLVDNIMRGAA